jgi:hypothetical protein
VLSGSYSVSTIMKDHDDLMTWSMEAVRSCSAMHMHFFEKCTFRLDIVAGDPTSHFVSMSKATQHE